MKVVAEAAVAAEGAAGSAAVAETTTAGEGVSEVSAAPVEAVAPAQPVEAPVTPVVAAAPAQPVEAPVRSAAPAAPVQPAQSADPAAPASQQPYGGVDQAQPCGAWATQSASFQQAGGVASQQAAGAQQPQNPYGAQQPYGGARQAGGSWGGAPVPPPQSPYGGQPGGAYGAPYAPQQPVYAEGCLSAAFNDIKASHGWFGKMLLLGLINCVPILNFVSWGYSLNWSREVPFGGRTPLPKVIFSGRNFEIGFYYFLIGLVVGLVSIAATSVLGFVPFVGWIAAIVLGFGLSMFAELASLRMAMAQQLGEGFKIDAVWNALKRNWTGLFAAVVLPSLITGVIIGVIWFIAIFVGVFGMVAAGAVGAASYGYAPEAVLATMLGGMGIVGVLAFIALVVVSMVLSTMASMLTVRAVGHWVGRYAPDWAAEMSDPAGYQPPRY